jgi:hypothetical protein
MARRKTNTEAIEPVETHNLALSIRRLRNAAPYESQKWKRCLYHALLMQSGVDMQALTKIREALNLP